MDLLPAFADTPRADVNALINRVHHADALALCAALPIQAETSVML